MLNEVFSFPKIMGFCEKIWYFFVVNLMFVLGAMPVLLFFLFFGISQVGSCLPLFMGCMVFVPPAFCGVLSSMRRLTEGRERGGIRDFFKGYTEGFLQKLLLSFVHMTVLFILWTNMEFFKKQFPSLILTIFFTLLFALFIVVTPNLYLLIARYDMSIPAIIKAAITITIAKPVCTLGYLASFALALAAFEVAAGTAVLFAASMVGFLLVLISSRMFLKLEESV